jgi:Leucine-rich repeat (LRR) protein
MFYKATLSVSFYSLLITSSRSSWQGKINRLKSLELCYSGVRDLHLSRLNDLSTLEELNLDSCPVGDWAIAYLAESCAFPNLRNLDLADTDLTDLGMAHLPKFTKLTRLSLFHCNISNAGLRHLISMSSLEILNLDSRDISDEGLIVLQALTNLKALDVFSARITDRGCSYLAKVKSLETLDLCGGGIGDLGCISLATLDNLTSLNLSQNERITNRGVAALAALSTLRALNLSNTRINSGALRYLSGLKHLESLAMYGCSGICDNGGLIEFQEALPKLKCLKLNMPNDDNGIIHSSKTEFMDYDDKDSETRHFFPQIDDLNSENDDLSMYSEHD